MVLEHIPLELRGFNKPPIKDDQLQSFNPTGLWDIKDSKGYIYAAFKVLVFL